MSASNEQLDPVTAVWLTGPGRPVVDAVSEALADGEDVLGVGTRLRAEGVAPGPAAAAVSAAQARQRAGALGWDAQRWLLTTSGVEQMSDPMVSRWRARRYADAGPVLDLGAGLGGDASMLRTAAGAVVAVERDPARAILLRANLGTDGALVVAGDGTQVARRASVPVHADPARRHGGRRARRLAEYGPPPAVLLEATPMAPGHGITLSPAVDLDDVDLPGGELEFVQRGRDLVEAMLWHGDLRRARREATATLLPDGVTIGREGPPQDPPVRAIGSVLLEPAPAAVRARIHGQLALEAGAWRVDERRALLTADHAPASPWWQASEVEATLPARPAAVRTWLRRADDLPLELVLHGVDTDVVAFWRALGRPRRGPEGRRLHLVRTTTGAMAVVTRPLTTWPDGGGSR